MKSPCFLAARLPCETRSLRFGSSVPGRCLWHPRWHLSGPPGAPSGPGSDVEFNDIMGESMPQKLDFTMISPWKKWRFHGIFQWINMFNMDNGGSQLMKNMEN